MGGQFGGREWAVVFRPLAIKTDGYYLHRTLRHERKLKNELSLTWFSVSIALVAGLCSSVS